MRAILCAAAVIVCACRCSMAVPIADGSKEGQQSMGRLGEVNFPTHCSEPAQATMEKGLALLHSFQYQESEQAFSYASKSDPQCALAYWGKAMALYNQLWDFPNAETLALGRSDVEQAQRLNPNDPRIRGYIEAAAAFFQTRRRRFSRLAAPRCARRREIDILGRGDRRLLRQQPAAFSRDDAPQLGRSIPNDARADP